MSFPETRRKQRACLQSLAFGLVVLCCPELFADVLVTEPTGGNNIPADKALNSSNGAGYTALGDIVLAEGFNNDFWLGNGQTFILTLPDGWRFNTAAGSVSFVGSKDITAASISVSASSLTVTFSVGGNTKLDTLTISGLQVQPLDGRLDPNAGYLLNLSVNPGTAVITGIFPDTSTFGLLNTVPGTPEALQIIMPPSTTATAGVLFATQPEVDTYDQFGNQCYYLDFSTIVTASLADGTNTLLGTVTQTVAGGDLAYSDLSVNVASTVSILFTAPGLTSVTSAPIVVSPGSASHLAFTTQPGSAASGSVFGSQPVVRSQDQFGNNSTVGLAAHQIATLTLAAGNGPLLGATNQEFGTSAGNGTATYTNLEIDASGAKQLAATSPGFTNALSGIFSVSGAASSQLLVLAPGETLAPGTLFGESGTATAQTAATPFAGTGNAAAGSYHLVTNGTDTR